MLCSGAKMYAVDQMENFILIINACRTLSNFLNMPNVGYKRMLKCYALNQHIPKMLMENLIVYGGHYNWQ
jgi:hypothetical protein